MTRNKNDADHCYHRVIEEWGGRAVLKCQGVNNIQMDTPLSSASY